ncbi:MAG: RNA polymerase factor sigma-54 [Candidatus Omnitrophota bacterium]
MEQILAQRQKQQLLLSPQLQQAIHILQLPFIELKNLIEQEVENNPCLEVYKPEPQSQTGPIKDNRYTNFPLSDSIIESENNMQVKQITLQEHLLRQMRLTFQHERDLRIGELIIGSLDERGYLMIAADEIAGIVNAEVETIEAIITIIQTFDPVGCAFRNIKECLLAQLRFKGRQSSLIYKIVELYLEDLANKRCALIAKQLNVDLEEIKSAAKEISLLEPNPARNFSYVDKSVYIIPDIIVDSGGEGSYKVSLNEDEPFFLRVNNFYKSVLARKNISDKERDFIRERISAGQNFIKCIQMRKETIKRLAEYLVKFQEEFLDKGREYLKPLTFKQVAQEIGRDESTVCRAVNNKYMDTPQGIFRLKDLFSSQVNGTGDTQAISSASIKERIRILVENEDKVNPLSDEDLLKQLHLENLKLSRRTIAKYRTQLKILPSYLRKA